MLAAGGAREDLHRALAGSVVASGDMAHATHPNYAEQHEPQHQIAVNGGPVLKVQPEPALRHRRRRRGRLRAGVRAGGRAAAALRAPRRPAVRLDRSGPITAARLGVTTVDVGAPQLAMHSARELCGAQDPGMYVASLAAFLSPAA